MIGSLAIQVKGVAAKKYRFHDSNGEDYKKGVQS